MLVYLLELIRNNTIRVRLFNIESKQHEYKVHTNKSYVSRLIYVLFNCRRVLVSISKSTISSIYANSVDNRYDESRGDYVVIFISVSSYNSEKQRMEELTFTLTFRFLR